MTRLLRVVAPHFVAGAEWRRDGAWWCVRAAPILRWMVGKPAVEVGRYLRTKGWEFEWIETGTTKWTILEAT